MADIVMTQNEDVIYEAEHADVKAWLLDPANNPPTEGALIGDTTRVLYWDPTGGAEHNGGNRLVYATEYLANYDNVYPEG